MSRQGDSDCTCDEFDWVEQLPLDQLELLEWLLGSGLKSQVGINTGTERWERGWKLVDAIACRKEKLSCARKD
jgi:hypothetical protein